MEAAPAGKGEGLTLTPQHLLDFYPMDQFKYPENWSSSDKPGERAGYVSLEKSEVYAKTAQGAFNLSGLGKVVKVSRLYSSPFTPSNPHFPGGIML